MMIIARCVRQFALPEYGEVRDGRGICLLAHSVLRETISYRLCSFVCGQSAGQIRPFIRCQWSFVSLLFVRPCPWDHGWVRPSTSLESTWPRQMDRRRYRRATD